ncbi:MAG: TetR/AcrR family transcriptional regulator [Bradymonadaceae bacterium]
MSPRPRSIDDDDILDAAREVFLEEGMQATTAAIADRAGISEGTIYRRFASKDELFLAAMDIPDPPGWTETLDEVRGEGDLEANLIRLGDEIIEFFETILPKVNMVMCSGFGGDPIFESEGQAPPLRSIEPLAEFVRDERRAGRLGDCDPEVVARTFLGAMFHFAFSELTGLNDLLTTSRGEYVEEVVDNLLRGIGS